MFRFIISAIALVVVSVCGAQDLIYTHHNEVIPAKVEQIKDYFIVYKKYENLDGPLYEISKNKIDSILYENGSKDNFYNQRTTSIQQRGRAINEGYGSSYIKEAFIGSKGKLQDKKNTLSAGYAAVVSNDYYSLSYEDINAFQISYQRLLWKNRIGVNATSYIGLNTEAYGAGLNALYFIKRKGMYKIGLGPEFMLSRFVSQYSRYYDDFGYSQIFSGMSNITSWSFNIYQSFDIAGKYVISAELIPGSVSSNSFLDKKPKSNNMYNRYDHSNFFMFRAGVGYRF